MIDGNQLREEFGRYLAEHKATRWGMDAALMHVCKIAYDAGKADGPGVALHRREYEIEVPATPTPDQFRDAAEMMPKPVAYGFGNTAITGHTNRLMMVRIDIPGGDQYAGAFWLPLVLADEAHTYGIACRAAGEAAGYVRDAERLAESIVREVAELPDRDSPADWPAAMLVTSDELRGIVLAHIQRGATHEGEAGMREQPEALIEEMGEANIPRTDAALRREVKP